MSTPLVSIITINYDQTEVTRDLLISLRKISYSKVEIIIVDNGSRDDSILNLRNDFPEINIIQTKKNLGFAGGNNVGFRIAKGEYIVLVNNDVEVTPNFLEPLVETFQLNPQCGLASPKIIFFDRNEVIQYAGSNKISPYTGRGDRQGYLEMDGGQYNSINETQLGHGACLMVSRDLIKRIGNMPEFYFLYYEEHDWTERAKSIGFKVFFVGTSKIYHKESISTGKNSPLKTYYLTRNRILFLRRNSSLIQRIVSYFFIVFIATPKNLFDFILQRDVPNLKAYIRGFVAGLFYNFNQRLQEFRRKYEETINENETKNKFILLILFFRKIKNFTWRVLTAKFYLRKCNTGKLVTTRGKPLIFAKGKIIIGDRVVIWSIFQRTILSVHAGAKLEIGSKTRLNGVHIAAKSHIIIGSNVRIAPYTLIMDSDFHDIEEHSSEGRTLPITINSNVWIASRSVILKGVTIGEGSVVAAGSVVTKDVPPNSMVAGVPAKVVRELKNKKNT
jgi:GT2 family glycosyltransferase/carbonic anhydrase/acetyltransferase-like protein (isoleucine patch superfamily)